MAPRAPRTFALLPLATAALVACTKGPPKPTPNPAATAPPSAASTPHPAPAPAPAPSSPAPSSSAPLPPALDAGPSACRVLYGPALQPFVGEAALAPTPGGVLVVTHVDGVATVRHVTPADPPLPPDPDRPRVTRPGCAVAGDSSFCMDREGGVHRRRLDGTGTESVVAHASPGGPLAAEAFDGGHVVVAYTAPHPTTEGIVREAFATLDGAPPVHLSDEGSGATHLSLARRGNAILAVLLDGRAAMTPVHARPLTLADGKLTAGDDVVVYVAGGAETSTRATVGTSASGAAFALLPIAREMGFGMESVRIDEPPRVDEPSTWSAYPNGLDPAPVAATRGVTPVRVARVRPSEARPDSPRILELGSLDDAGAFSPYGMVPSRGRVRDVALLADASGAVWLAFTDAAGTWLSLRACP